MEALQPYAQALEKKGFRVRIFETAAQACDALLDLIPDGASVGFGGSMTIETLGVYDVLAQRGNPVYWHWKNPPQARAQVTKDAFCADYYLMSANAIGADATLWNIDGNGNRLATMVGGRGKLIVVAGVNKCVPKGEDPVARIKREACPKNAVRLGLNTPCAKTGQCSDCNSPDRMCKLTLALAYPPSGRDMEVWLVGEALGY